MRNKILNILLGIAILSTIYFGFQYGKELLQVQSAKERTEKLSNLAKMKEKKEIKTQKIANNSIEVDEQTINKLDLPLIDIPSLKNQINSDIHSWIHVPGTRISEPIVKGQTNLTYLRKDAYGYQNYLGAIFFDENASTQLDDQITYIFGHNTHNGMKFADLDYFFDPEFFAKNRHFYLYLNGKIYKYEVLHAFQSPPRSTLYPKKKFTKEDFEYYKGELGKYGVPANVLEDLTAEDKLTLLITCREFNDSEARRMVLGKLVEVGTY